MVPDSMDNLSWLRNRLEEADPDLLREMVAACASRLMDAEVDALCGAGHGERTAERVNLPERAPGTDDQR